MSNVATLRACIDDNDVNGGKEGRAHSSPDGRG